MSTYYYAVNAAGDYIFDNVPMELRHYIFSLPVSQSIVKIRVANELRDARIGKNSNRFGSIYTLTTEPKYINRYKLFKELVEMSLLALEPLTTFQNKMVEANTARNEEFVHNLTSLNSYGIQDLFTLIPQSILTENINRQNEIIKGIIAEKPNVAVKTLQKLIKYNLAMKVEFSVFEQTLQPYASINKMDHSIRKLILSILQIFIEDFENKRIEVSLDASEKRLSVDYDSLFVSFYYILDNAVKYCCRGTKFKIVFKEEADGFSVLFIMISIPIHDADLKNLSSRGFRSSEAIKLNSDGHGIGMYRIQKTLKLNNAVLEVSPRINEYKKELDGITFEGNQFKVKFLGQQDWFKTNM